MDSLLTPSNVTFVIGLLAIIFSVYNYFRNPQISSDKTDALLTQRLDNILQQVVNFNTAFQAHTLSDTAAFENFNRRFGEIDRSVTRLTTIIEERVTRK